MENIPIENVILIIIGIAGIWAFIGLWRLTSGPVPWTRKKIKMIDRDIIICASMKEADKFAGKHICPKNLK